MGGILNKRNCEGTEQLRIKNFVRKEIGGYIDGKNEGRCGTDRQSGEIRCM